MPRQHGAAALVLTYDVPNGLGDGRPYGDLPDGFGGQRAVRRLGRGKSTCPNRAALQHGVSEARVQPGQGGSPNVPESRPVMRLEAVLNSANDAQPGEHGDRPRDPSDDGAE